MESTHTKRIFYRVSGLVCQPSTANPYLFCISSSIFIFNMHDKTTSLSCSLPQSSLTISSTQKKKKRTRSRSPSLSVALRNIRLALLLAPERSGVAQNSSFVAETTMKKIHSMAKLSIRGSLQSKKAPLLSSLWPRQIQGSNCHRGRNNHHHKVCQHSDKG